MANEMIINVPVMVPVQQQLLAAQSMIPAYPEFILGISIAIIMMADLFLSKGDIVSSTDGVLRHGDDNRRERCQKENHQCGLPAVHRASFAATQASSQPT